MTKEKHGKYKWTVWAAIVSVVVFLLSPVVIYRGKYKAAFERRVADLAAAGYPVSLADLERRYVLPAGADNAADVYIEAFGWYVDPNEAELEWLPARGKFIASDEMPPYPPEVIATIEASLEKNRRCLELLDKAAGIEHCLFPREKYIYYFMTDYLTEIKRAAQLLAERNIYLAQTQQAEALFSSLTTSAALSDRLSAQPFLIDHLVTNGIQAMFVPDIQTCLNLTTFSEEQLMMLQQQLRRMRDRNTLADALISERAGTLEFMQHSSLAQIKDAGYWVFGNFLDLPLFILYSLPGLNHKDAVLLLDYADQMIEATALPPHEQPAVFIRIGSEIDDYSQIHWLLHNVSSSYSRIFQINLRVMGNLLCGETGLAIERYRLAHQALPESLEALVPEYLAEVPRDPFDGAPLRYIRHETGGYTVYTIGDDGIDHGGQSSEQLSKTTGARTSQGDWPFTVKR